MTPMQFANDLAGGKVQCREQCGRSVAHVIVSAPLGNAKRVSNYSADTSR
jgi:hypothetical protein